MFILSFFPLWFDEARCDSFIHSLKIFPLSVRPRPYYLFLNNCRFWRHLGGETEIRRAIVDNMNSCYKSFCDSNRPTTTSLPAK